MKIRKKFANNLRTVFFGKKPSFLIGKAKKPSFFAQPDIFK